MAQHFLKSPQARDLALGDVARMSERDAYMWFSAPTGVTGSHAAPIAVWLALTASSTAARSGFGGRFRRLPDKHTSGGSDRYWTEYQMA